MGALQKRGGLENVRPRYLQPTPPMCSPRFLIRLLRRELPVCLTTLKTIIPPSRVDRGLSSPPPARRERRSADVHARAFVQTYLRISESTPGRGTPRSSRGSVLHPHLGAGACHRKFVQPRSMSSAPSVKKEKKPQTSPLPHVVFAPLSCARIIYS